MFYQWCFLWCLTVQCCCVTMATLFHRKHTAVGWKCKTLRQLERDSRARNQHRTSQLQIMQLLESGDGGDGGDVMWRDFPPLDLSESADICSRAQARVRDGLILSRERSPTFPPHHTRAHLVQRTNFVWLFLSASVRKRKPTNPNPNARRARAPVFLIFPESDAHRRTSRRARRAKNPTASSCLLFFIAVSENVIPCSFPKTITRHARRARCECVCTEYNRSRGLFSPVSRSQEVTVRKCFDSEKVRTSTSDPVVKVHVLIKLSRLNWSISCVVFAWRFLGLGFYLRKRKMPFFDTLPSIQLTRPNYNFVFTQFKYNFI